MLFPRNERGSTAHDTYHPIANPDNQSISISDLTMSCDLTTPLNIQTSTKGDSPKHSHYLKIPSVRTFDRNTESVKLSGLIKARNMIPYQLTPDLCLGHLNRSKITVTVCLILILLVIARTVCSSLLMV